MRKCTLMSSILLSLLLTTDAHAYPFMIRHGYTSCGECHVDPSGAGALTEYGRGQAEVLLRSPPLSQRPEDWQPSKIKDFLFGVVKLPEPLVLQADSRALVIPEPGDFRFILMQAD